jgi:beta-lactamase class A
LPKKPMLIFTRLFSLVFLLAAGALTALYARQVPPVDNLFANGTIIAGIPVGGLNEDQVRQRVVAAYATPVELDYRGERILASPDGLGFSLALDDMLAQAHQPLERSGFDRLWAILWNEPQPEGSQIELDYAFSPQKARAYLENELAPRYDRPPQAPYAVSSTGYQPGSPGWELDVETALPLIETALPSLSNRSVVLPVMERAAPDLALEQLQEVLVYTINRSELGGLVAFAMTDLRNGEQMNFALQNGSPVDPEIAFTAASTIKVPIMLSVLKRTAEPTPEDVNNLLLRMSALSENPPADRLMSDYIGEIRGPLIVTEDIKALGLKNTFLAGYFYIGAPLLDRFTTPANSRSDINLGPDIYNQTTAGEMRDLLTWIYSCANEDSGPIRTTFGDAVTQTECQLILDVMAQNKTALLFEAGIPDDTKVSHKHGWVEEADGQLRTMSDVAVVYTPGGDYAVSIFIYQPQRLNFDATNNLVAELSLAIYNAFNIDDQYPWMAYPRGGE